MHRCINHNIFRWHMCHGANQQIVTYWNSAAIICASLFVPIQFARIGFSCCISEWRALLRIALFKSLLLFMIWNSLYVKQIDEQVRIFSVPDCQLLMLYNQKMKRNWFVQVTNYLLPYSNEKENNSFIEV